MFPRRTVVRTAVGLAALALPIRRRAAVAHGVADPPASIPAELARLRALAARLGGTVTDDTDVMAIDLRGYRLVYSYGDSRMVAVVGRAPDRVVAKLMGVIAADREAALARMD